MRGAWREPFFITWSGTLIVLVTVTASLDGGVHSPLSQLEGRVRWAVQLTARLKALEHRKAQRPIAILEHNLAAEPGAGMLRMT